MSLTVQIIGIVGTLVGLGVTLWKIAQWSGRNDAKLTGLEKSIRRLELRMRVYDRRIDRLEDEEKPRWR